MIEYPAEYLTVSAAFVQYNSALQQLTEAQQRHEWASKVLKAVLRPNNKFEYMSDRVIYTITTDADKNFTIEERPIT